MAQRSPAAGKSPERGGQSKRIISHKRSRNGAADFERKCFEFDRRIVAGLLDTLRGAISEGANQIALIADEQMFEEALSGNFARTAKRLNRMVAKLEKLLGDIGSASGYPKGANEQRISAVVHSLPTRP
jgi:hypothetical protein